MSSDPSPTSTYDERALLSDPGAFEAEVLFSGGNARIQVLRYAYSVPRALVEALESAARERGLGKVFMKAHAKDAEALVAAGLEREATIRGYFSGEDAHVLGLFVDPARRLAEDDAGEAEILERVRAAERRPEPPPLEDGYVSAHARESDLEELAELYGNVFASYPYPINQKDYLLETMRSHVVYAIVRDQGGRLVAAASAETVPGQASAEMTDFATLPDQRCKGLAQHLLASLEGAMQERAIPNLYTIARARSTGMTRTFYNAGYELTGTLVNNCHIAGRFENMHVWCKTL